MDKYGLIGYRSDIRSPSVTSIESFRMRISMPFKRNYEIPSVDELPESAQFDPELKGINVTIPYKEEKVLPFLESDYLTRSACHRCSERHSCES